MLYMEIIAVCSQIHTKHINILCGQNVELLNVKRGGTYSYQCKPVSYTRKCSSIREQTKHQVYDLLTRDAVQSGTQVFFFKYRDASIAKLKRTRFFVREDEGSRFLRNVPYFYRTI